MSKQVKAAFDAIAIIAMTVRKSGPVPYDLLYATVSEHISMDRYHWIIRILIGQGILHRDGNMLTWKQA
jgi:hypothetical protein